MPANSKYPTRSGAGKSRVVLELPDLAATRTEAGSASRIRIDSASQLAAEDSRARGTSKTRDFGETRALDLAVASSRVADAARELALESMSIDVTSALVATSAMVQSSAVSPPAVSSVSVSGKKPTIAPAAPENPAPTPTAAAPPGGDKSLSNWLRPVAQWAMARAARPSGWALATAIAKHPRAVFTAVMALFMQLSATLWYSRPESKPKHAHHHQVAKSKEQTAASPNSTDDASAAKAVVKRELAEPERPELERPDFQPPDVQGPEVERPEIEHVAAKKDFATRSKLDRLRAGSKRKPITTDSRDSEDRSNGRDEKSASPAVANEVEGPDLSLLDGDRDHPRSKEIDSPARRTELYPSTGEEDEDFIQTAALPSRESRFDGRRAAREREPSAKIRGVEPLDDSERADRYPGDDR